MVYSTTLKNTDLWNFGWELEGFYSRLQNNIIHKYLTIASISHEDLWINITGIFNYHVLLLLITTCDIHKHLLLKIWYLYNGFLMSWSLTVRFISRKVKTHYHHFSKK